MKDLNASNPRSYGQQCAVAVALDHVGDRWTLLIVRELLAGPARFGDLEAALDGVAPNLLSGRLKRMTGAGIVEVRTVFGASAYALTDLGEALRPVVKALGMWGAAIGLPHGDAAAPITRASSAALALETVLAAAPPPDPPILLGLRVGGDTLAIALGGGEPVTVRTEVNAGCDAYVTTTLEALSALPVDGLPLERLTPATSNPADVNAAATLATMVMNALETMQQSAEN